MAKLRYRCHLRANAVASFGLRRVEGVIGAQHRFRIARVVHGERRDAGRDRDAERLTSPGVDHQCANRAAERLGYPYSVGERSSGKKDRELLTAHPGKAVGCPDARAEFGTDRAKQVIAGIVA